MMGMRRKLDAVWMLTALVGLVVLVGTLALKFKLGDGLTDTAFGIGMAVGAGLISPQFITEMVAKRLGAGQATREDAPGS